MSPPKAPARLALVANAPVEAAQVEGRARHHAALGQAEEDAQEDELREGAGEGVAHADDAEEEGERGQPDIGAEALQDDV
jgi:hypothetical protein